MKSLPILFFIVSFSCASINLNKSPSDISYLKIDSIEVYTCFHANPEHSLNWSCFLNPDSMIAYSKNRNMICIKDSNSLKKLELILNEKSKLRKILINEPDTFENNGEIWYNTVLFRVYSKNRTHDICNYHRYNVRYTRYEVVNYNPDGHRFFCHGNKIYKERTGVIDSLYKVYFNKVNKVYQEGFCIDHKKAKF